MIHEVVQLRAESNRELCSIDIRLKVDEAGEGQQESEVGLNLGLDIKICHVVGDHSVIVLSLFIVELPAYCNFKPELKAEFIAIVALVNNEGRYRGALCNIRAFALELVLDEIRLPGFCNLEAHEERGQSCENGFHFQ